MTESSAISVDGSNKSSSQLPEAKAPIRAPKAWMEHTVSLINEKKGTILAVAVIAAAIMVTAASPALIVFTLPVALLALSTLLVSKKDVQKLIQLAKETFHINQKDESDSSTIDASPIKDAGLIRAEEAGFKENPYIGLVTAPYLEAETNVEKIYAKQKILNVYSVPAQVHADFERLAGLSITDYEDKTTHTVTDAKEEVKTEILFNELLNLVGGNHQFAAMLAALSTQGEFAPIVEALQQSEGVLFKNEGLFVEYRDLGEEIEINLRAPGYFLDQETLESPVGIYSGNFWITTTITVDKEQGMAGDFSSITKSNVIENRSGVIQKVSKTETDESKLTDTYLNNMNEFFFRANSTVNFMKVKAEEPNSSGEVSPEGSNINGPIN